MFKFFKTVQQRIGSEQTLKSVIEMSKSGNKSDALKKCTKLVEQYPYDVQIRHRLVMLQQEMGREINIPSIAPNK